MVIFRRHAQIYKILVIVGALLLTGLFSSCAVADDSDNNAYAIITSRFILWDSNEKLLDPHFSIHVFDFNTSVNHTSFYGILINENEYNNSFINHAKINFNMTGIEEIYKLTIAINNKTVMTALDIDIVGGVSENQVKQPYEPFTINLSPLEWSAKEWNIFLAIVGATILGMIFAYRRVKNYRKYRGVREWKRRA